jgi:hypothetical protein
VVRSACCAGDEGGDDVGGVAVEGYACPVVAHGGSGVSVSGLLNVAQRDTGIEGGSDEAVSECVWTDLLGDVYRFGDPAHDARCAVAVERLAVVAVKDGAVKAFADDEIDCSGGPRCQWHPHLPPLRTTVRLAVKYRSVHRAHAFSSGNLATRFRRPGQDAS